MIGALAATAVAHGLGAGLAWAAAVRLLTRTRAGREHPDWGALATPGHTAVVVGLGAVCGVATVLACGHAVVPAAALGLWAALAVPGLVAAVLDARTTWLPLPWLRVCWAASALGLLALTLAAPLTGLTALAGAGLSTAGAWALHRLVPGALAFGDVRLAAVTGAVAGSLGLDAVLLAWWVTTVTGALTGLALRVLTRRRGFPYGPALWLGPWGALAWQAVA